MKNNKKKIMASTKEIIISTNEIITITLNNSTRKIKQK